MPATTLWEGAMPATTLWEGAMPATDQPHMVKKGL